MRKIINCWWLLPCYLYAPKFLKNLFAIFEFVIESNLLSSTQSGFKPNDYCVNQLFSITHSIFSAFVDNPSLEVRGVFLELSKAFDSICLEGLLYKTNE